MISPPRTRRRRRFANRPAAATASSSLLETQFIDSSVVKALFETDALLRAEGRRLVIHVNTASIVRRVLEISNIPTLIYCTASLDHAIRIACAVERES